MAEREKRLDLGPLVVPVSNEDALSIDNLEVLARPCVISRGVLDTLGEGALESCG